MEPEHEKPHAIIIPYPLPGHVIPSIHLALKLASNGFAITFVNTQSTHNHITGSRSDQTAHIDNHIFSHVRGFGLDIRYKTVSDGFSSGFDRSRQHDQFIAGLQTAFQSFVDELVNEIVHKSKPRASCLITDTLYVWSSAISEKYNLINISFWTKPASTFSFYYHFDAFVNRGKSGAFGKINREELMSYLSVPDKSGHKAIKEVSKADFLVINTVQELEQAALSALEEERLPAYAIGPILPPKTQSSVSTSLRSESECTQWLNPKPPYSVLYVSCGSYANASKDEILEIAEGLLLSEVSFIWVLRSDIVSSNETDFLPVGFQEKIEDRGLIVPLCFQIHVLSHPAIGGFLTRCWWNSILESVWCSVPVLCIPPLTDELTNRNLVVNDWQIGLNLCDPNRITREEVSRKIRCLMSSKSRTKLRENIKKVRQTLGNALSTNGSSDRNFNEFIHKVKSRIVGESGPASH